MKSPIKHILLRKHKTYTEKDKAIILNFTKTTKELLKNSNLWVKGLTISVAKFLIKKHFGKDTEIYINLYDQQCWCDQVVEEINVSNFGMKREDPELYDKIHEFEQYWLNFGIYEKNYEKYNDTFEHYIPIEKQYDNFQDVLNDMNQQINDIITEYFAKKYVEKNNKNKA
jgi:hypothetical protein